MKIRDKKNPILKININHHRNRLPRHFHLIVLILLCFGFIIQRNVFSINLVILQGVGHSSWPMELE